MPDFRTPPDLPEVDDKSIPDDRALWRRINPAWIVPDKNSGAFRISSQAFQNQVGFDCLSVLDSDLVLTSGRSPSDVLSDFDGFFLASVTAGLARSKAQTICFVTEDEEHAHVHICWEKIEKRAKIFCTRSRMGVRSGGLCLLTDYNNWDYPSILIADSDGTWYRSE